MIIVVQSEIGGVVMRARLETVVMIVQVVPERWTNACTCFVFEVY